MNWYVQPLSYLFNFLQFGLVNLPEVGLVYLPPKIPQVVLVGLHRYLKMFCNN
jgi:hypothetical protein